MAVKCSACGEASARHQVARPEYDPVAPQMLGGILMALIFALSRRRRFRCDRCGELFYSHTIGSRVWLAFWILFWVSLVLGILGFLIAEFAN
jgi:formylmethanofuran dehydrogenase subunit E